MHTALDLEPLIDEVSRQGFAFAPSAQMRPLLGVLADWEAFAASWNDLPRDTHLPDGHRYRRRRHATLSARGGESGFWVEPHQPHYQGLEYNALVGGIQRWFEPVSPRIVTGETFGAVIALCLGLFGRLRPRTEWRTECHQFRIEASQAASGQPTPEGVHRDGVDYVLVVTFRALRVS